MGEVPIQTTLGPSNLPPNSPPPLIGVDLTLVTLQPGETLVVHYPLLTFICVRRLKIHKDPLLRSEGTILLSLNPPPSSLTPTRTPLLWSDRLIT